MPAHRYLSLAAAAAIGLTCITTETQAQGSWGSDVLGFECTTCWTLEAGSGPVAPVTDASHGSAALKIPGNGYRRIKSAPISLPSVGSNVVRLSIKVASPASPWEGVSLILAAPSVGIFWEDLGLVSLGGATPGQYVEVQFVLPEATRALLSGVDDLTLRVVVNASQDVTVDDLRFQAPDPPSGPSTQVRP